MPRPRLTRDEVLARCGSAVREANPHLFVREVAIEARAPPAAVAPEKPPRGPRRARAMNKTEGRYAQLLEARRLAGEIREYSWERVTLRLAEDVRYTPDFFVVTVARELQFHEVKGPLVQDDARVKFRCAVELFPEFRFFWCESRGRKDPFTVTAF